MIVVKVTPPGQSEVGWKMKPGDAVTVEWPGAGKVEIAVDEDEAVVISGAKDDAGAV